MDKAIDRVEQAPGVEGRRQEDDQRPRPGVASCEQVRRLVANGEQRQRRQSFIVRRSVRRRITHRRCLHTRDPGRLGDHEGRPQSPFGAEHRLSRTRLQPTQRVPLLSSKSAADAGRQAERLDHDRDDALRSKVREEASRITAVPNVGRDVAGDNPSRGVLPTGGRIG